MDGRESLVTIFGEGSNICLSGGATGADSQWGLQAGKAGHGVIHWSFQEHRSLVPEQELVRLTQEQLLLADGALERANATLKRSWPSKSESTNSLLRRNWYQVKDASSVYAVCEFKKGYPQGGTAWAIQMYLDRFQIDGEPANKCKLYVLNKDLLYWYEYNLATSKWDLVCGRPPMPKGIWAGIGSRDISALCRVEIRKVMKTYVLDDQQLASLFPIVEEPKVDDIIYIPDRKILGKGAMNRAGGWATVRRISTSDRLWVSVTETSDNEEFDWNELKDIQIELRSKFGNSRAISKPDYSTESKVKS